MTQLDPYVTFPGTAREAVAFYAQVLGGQPAISTFGEYGGDPSAPGADGVMHAQLESPSGLTLMASDAPPGQEASHRPGNNVSLSLSGDDTEELRGYWERLSEGAAIDVPLERQVWGDEFGMLTDRFGIQWMVNISGGDQPG